MQLGNISREKVKRKSSNTKNILLRIRIEIIINKIHISQIGYQFSNYKKNYENFVKILFYILKGIKIKNKVFLIYK